MMQIKKSKTADTRSCDYAVVTKETLRSSSLQHIEDVKKGIGFLKNLLDVAANRHDADKLTDLDLFHSDFVGGFKNKTWWDNHRKATRHHLFQIDGRPLDVNLIDVLEMIVDCVMAGMGRTGSVSLLKIPDNLLKTAFDNTVELLKENVVVLDA